jgi:Domain of unknown function (DUF4249)
MPYHSTFRFAVLCFFTFWQSCGFQQLEPIEIPPQPSRIVAFCELFNDPAREQFAVLSRTRNIGGPVDYDVQPGDTIFASPDRVVINPDLFFDYVPGATVELLKADTPVKTFWSADAFLKNFFVADTIPFISGQPYTLRVQAPGFETITATQTAPASVSLIGAKYSRNTFQAPGIGQSDEVILTFQDPPGVGNVYAVDILQEERVLRSIFVKGTWQQYYENFWRLTETIQIDNNAVNARFLTDRLMDGQRYEWRIGVRLAYLLDPNKPIPDQYLKLFVRFRTTSEDYVQYQRSIEAARTALDNPFAEPVAPFSNFNNGIGIFVISGKPDTLSLRLR